MPERSGGAAIPWISDRGTRDHHISEKAASRLPGSIDAKSPSATFRTRLLQANAQPDTPSKPRISFERTDLASNVTEVVCITTDNNRLEAEGKTWQAKGAGQDISMSVEYKPGNDICPAQCFRTAPRSRCVFCLRQSVSNDVAPLGMRPTHPFTVRQVTL